MGNTNRIKILESKLKRHKISHFRENGKVIIGQAKTDYLQYYGLGALPIVGAIGICLLMYFNDFEIFRSHSIKVIGGIFFLFGTGLFNIIRARSKKKQNSSLKTLEDGCIKILEKEKESVFDLNNTMVFEYSSQQINEEIYAGKLYLISNDNQKFQILGFDDTNEKYILDDLKWFSEYLADYIGLEKNVA